MEYLDKTLALIDLFDDDEIFIKNSPYNFNGSPVPRVTEVISKMISEESLMYWSNNLGFKGKSYRKELNVASAIGTETHDLIHKFLIGESSTTNNIPYLGFRKWWIDISTNHTVEVLGSEESLSCPWFGGTYDALLKIDGQIYLIDFKTSNRVTYKYFLQLSAYTYMIEKNKNISVNGMIILQLNKKIPEYKEYLLSDNNDEQKQFLDHCFEAFISLVKGYNNIHSLESQYKSIFNRGREVHDANYYRHTKQFTE